MDPGVLLGIVVAVASLLIANSMEGGTLGSLVNESAALIIFGGTIGATMVSVGMRNFLKLPKVFVQAFKKNSVDPNETIDKIVTLAQKARREGLLSLEEEIQDSDDPFLAKGIQMVVDGADPEMVRGLLETEIDFTQRRHATGASIFETAGGYAPTMGIIGTVQGLIHVLSNMSSPEKLAESIAVAFLATFYGIASANLFWLPVAGKLKVKSAEEMATKEMVLEGVLSIQRGDNPTLVREKLTVFLAPKEARRQETEEAAPAAEPRVGEERA